MQRRVRLPMPESRAAPRACRSPDRGQRRGANDFRHTAVRHRQIHRTRAVVDEPCGTGFDGRPGTLSSLARDRRRRFPARSRLDHESRTT